MNLLLGVALVLGLMIMIHEWGHFIVARLFGVRVDVFSIGFGPRLFGWKRGATDYRISALPFGGYVRMAGQDLSEVDSNDVAPTGAPDELMSKPRWQRALISFAGPAVNLIFPILLLTGLFVAVGLPYSSFYDLPVQVVALPTGQASPLQVGDKLLSINGVRNPTWEQAQKALKQAAPGDKLKLEVENAGQTRTVEVPLTASTTLDRTLGYLPRPPILDEAAPGTPAERAARKTVELIRTKETIGVVGMLFSGRVSVRQLQGAVGISRAAGEAVRKGPLAVISLMVLISVNLGILNLLPIPILDGGNILLLTLEGIRRRDFSLAFKERFVQVGFVFLLVLFAYVMYNDVVRMLPIHS